VESRAARNLLDDPVEHRRVVYEQRPRRRPDEHLDARRTGQPLQFGDVLDVVLRPADIEREVAEHAVMGGRDFLAQPLRRRRAGVGVGHLEHGRDAAEHRTAAARLEVLFVRQPRLAKMHLAVDHAGDDCQPRGIDDFARRTRCNIAQCSDPPVRNRDIAFDDSVLIDDCAALDEDLVGFCHVALSCIVAAVEGSCGLRLPPHPHYLSQYVTPRPPNAKAPAHKLGGRYLVRSEMRAAAQPRCYRRIRP